MKIILDNINGRIVTDNPELLSTLVDLYSFQDKGAFYSAAYKKKQWDGKRRFITKGGQFKSGLLNKIVEDLKKVNITPEISHQFQALHSPKYSIDFSLRDYQKEYVDKCLSQRRGIVESSTGSGKTAMMAGICSLYKDKNILILFNKKQLVDQTYRAFVNQFNLKNVGVCFGDGYLYGNIMLCTYQSLERIVGTPMERPDILLVDECHEFCQGKFTSKLINVFPSASIRLGFTATVPTDNIRRYTLEGAFGPVIKCVSTQELIEQGYLAKPIIQVIKITHADNSGVYLDKYQELIATNEYRNNLIKSICFNLKHPNPKVAIIANSLNHAELLVTMLSSVAVKIEGKDSVDYRNRMIKQFINKPGLSVLIGTNILQTGVNINEITHLINARGLKSDIATIQALGRSMRKDQDPVVYVYDFYDDDDGLLKKHSNARIRAYKKEGHKVEVIEYGNTSRTN